jgi:hypothetical protein
MHEGNRGTSVTHPGKFLTVGQSHEQRHEQCHEQCHEQRVFLICCVAKRARVLLVSSTNEIATVQRRWTEEMHGGFFLPSVKSRATSFFPIYMLHGKASTSSSETVTHPRNFLTVGQSRATSFFVMLRGKASTSATSS